MRQELNYILNYNTTNRNLLLHVGKLSSQRGNFYSLTYAQKLRSMSIFRTLLVALMMVCNFVGAWAQITPTTDTNGNDILDENEKHLYLIQTNQFQSFYITPNGNNLNTVNLPHESMLWYFIEAENDNGTQYYYIVNNSTGKYICNTDYASKGRTIQLATFDASSTDKFKFKLVENNPDGATGYYNINIKPNGSGWLGLNKQGGNQEATNKNIRLTDNQYINQINSRWKFIPYDGTLVWPNPPFTLSAGESKTYYRIRNKKNSAFYISTDQSTSKVTYSNSEGNDMAWYFKEASSDGLMKYYYIINPASGDKYMYYDGTATNGSDQSNAVSIKDINDAGAVADRFLFVIVQAAIVGSNDTPINGYYMIVPKLLTDKLWNSNSLGQKTQTDGTNMGIIGSRGDVYSHWSFVTTEYPMHCAKPTITYDSSTGKMTITAASPAGASIHYTTDGETEPTSSTGTSYSAPFSITGQTTIKAIASKSGYEDSEVATATFYKVATPTIQNNGENAISITCETAGTTIYYTTDGTDPTTSSAQYTGPLTEDVSRKTIKAIAVRNGWVNSDIGSGSVKLQCAKPVFTRNGNELTISCTFPTSGVSIYYTTNGDNPTSSSNEYFGEITVSENVVIKAIAIATDYEDSEIATKKIFTPLEPTDGKYILDTQEKFENFIDMASTEYSNGHFILRTNVTAGFEIPLTFTGIFDGEGHTISSLGHALFNSINNATVKNVILVDVDIDTDGNAGAIANEAAGDSRIYNVGVLSGSVDGDDNVGGIVGLLDGSSRVINCFSYATIEGGSNVGGIVGYNNMASTASNMKTMVMNCMFYGDITGGSTVSPIYGGQNINNLHNGLNTYNYYAYDNLKTTAISTDKYNCALGVEDRFLKRIEFYRQLLNSNRRLAAKYASTTSTTVNATDMMKWVLETADRKIAAPKPYPILKAQDTYPSIINYDTRNLADYSEAHRNEGLKTGTLTVNISIGSGYPTGAAIKAGKSSITLTRTDKDFARFNYNYDKVQLPYYNEVGEGNYTGNKVVTGWKITGMTGGTAGTYSAADEWGGYNFADRNCTNKDLYGTGGSNRVFSQGAYFDVPYGVTGITIEPYWGEAAYVSDEYLDVVFSTAYVAQNVEALGKPFGANGVDVLINGSTQKVYSSINNAVDALGTGGTVYDHAVVLVGNVHLAANPPAANKSFTIMSADLDKDNEPDCSFIFGHNDRQVISPVRFDFINMPGIAMAQKPNGAESFRNVSIFKPKGWFETTNTCLAHFVQFEYDNGGKSAAPVIIQGGLIDQFVSTKVSEPTVTQYIHLGGNAWFKDFGNGTHSDGNKFTPHVPISVTGGEYEGFYLSGTYRPDAAVKADNAECYISSGHFGEVAGAAQQQINGNVQWQIYNADIDNFFGGGINFNKPVTGNIQTDIINSHVGTFCGGPKFGDMVTDMTVTTNATGCTFGTYFGAGYGGISYNRVRTQDKSGTNVNFSSWQGDYTGDKGKFSSTNNGVATDFDYEFFVWSTGVVGARFYVKYSSLSMAKTNDVTSTLNNCIINRNFYGGGNLGKVDGTATSVLNGCTVEGNVFGGGYSATKPKVPYRTGGFSTFPKIDVNAGVFDMGEMSDTIHLTLIPGTLSNNTSAINTTDKTIVTNVDLTSLGQVTTTDLTISGSTIVRGQIFDAAGNVTETTGGVFGGGDMSAVHGNTEVKVQGTESTDGVLNVFGGGNTADVGGNTVVNVTDGLVSQAVYGGGKGQNTTVIGDVTVNINGGEIGNVYGGSAFGAVNATKGPSYPANIADISATEDKSTVVNINGGNVTEKVFGGGLGRTTPSNIAAQSFGNVTVTVAGGTVGTAVYGGSNANGVLKKNSTVTITGGTVGTVANPITDAVFGGGFGEPTLVEGNVTVNIGTKSNDETPVYTGTATINGNIYGGGALGNVNTSKPASELVFDATKKVDVNLYRGTINGDVFGGGLGQKTGENGAESDILSYVGGDVTVTLDGAKIPGSIFGCNNLNGTPKGHVKVWVKRTVDSDKSSVEALAKTREQRTTYDVAAVYGGGNKADYIPTNALIVLPDKNAEDYDDKLTKLNAARTEVIIEGCEETSINYVYGGGNAAAVPATEVTIKGTYIINNVYGGGNGSGDNNPGANVGIINPTAYAANHENGTYGTGKAVTRLLGGYINNVYGGSNTKGDIVGGTDVRTKQRTDIFTKPEYCTDLNVGKVFGAGSHADMDGDVNIVLECMPEDYVKEVYGGAEQATVNGNVSLIVTSGKFGRVFGGNNAGGDIRGSITVNVSEDGCKPLIIGELYGGGNQAPYSIYGCTQSGETWTANTEGTLYFNEATAGRAAVEVYVFSCTSIGRIFGGGNQAEVIGNTRVWVNTWKGYINGEKQSDIGKIGQIFGGGNAAKVTGNTLVDVGTALANEGEDIGVNITKGTYTDASHGTYISPTTNEYIDLEEAGIYGGGYSADVDGDATLNIGTKNQNMGINIAGNIFGGGYGETTKVTGNVVVNIGANIGTNESPNYVGYANITGDVYGGSAKGKVNTTDGTTISGGSPTTNVNFYAGTINGNLYGGGLGESTHAADVYGGISVNVKGGNVYNVFGCNNTNGTPKSTVAVNIDGGAISQSVYGGGNQAIMEGSPVVNVTGGTIGTLNQGGAVYGNVYGGGLGSDGTGSQTDLEKVKAGLVKGDTEINISGGTILHNIYGGGAYGSVGDFTYNESTGVITGYTSNGKATISITGGTIGTTGKENGMVFGSSRGDVGEPDGIHDKLAWVYDTEVNIGTQNDATEGPAIKGSVYGGGENGHTYHDAEVKIYSGTIGINTGEDVEYRDGENNITYSGKDYNYPYRGNVYGAGCGTDKYDNNTKYNLKSGGVGHDTRVTIYGGQVVHNVYGAGAMGSVNGSTTVTISGGTIGVDGSDNGNVYAAARGEVGLTDHNYASVTNTTLNISGGEVKGSAFGGGQAGIVKGNVAVNVSGGKVINDVYGGGALANTNTDNWNDTNLVTTYDKITATLTVGTSDVSGLYKKVDENYILQGPNSKAESGAEYYRRFDTAWAAGKTSASNTTTVKLTGGKIGNVFGGGLGNAETAVYVYGDITINVNKTADITANGGTGATFTRELAQNITVGGKNYASIPITGNIFGANNFNGSPKGNITVEIFKTKRVDGGSHVLGNYEIQGVYGGGNMANYLPATGKETKVIIHGCGDTSIEKVYGGGNSASVPSTDVTIFGAFDIGYAFGGGNGSMPVRNSAGTWVANDGAMVTGDAKISAKGGRIGQVFGGSDAKGDILGSSTTDTSGTGGECGLTLTRLFGAGNEADVAGDVNLILSGCGTSDAIQFVHGGSYNAHISGNVNLTITSGVYTNVFGGNDARGSIGGNIIVNIEETDECKPIIIQNLMGGGNEAPYPGTKKDGTEYPDNHPASITINVKSATRIDNIYGGGLKADVKGNTTVNINMRKGSLANQTFAVPASYTGETIPNIHAGKIDNTIGTIGNIYGGGNEGNIVGNATVNIGTATSVGILKRKSAGGAFVNEKGDSVYNYKGDLMYDMEGETKVYRTVVFEDKDVLGAHITGNVFGGGNKADVTGNSSVNICATGVTYNSTTDEYDYTSVDFSGVATYEGVKIGGNVYGGGNLGSVGTYNNLNTAMPTSRTSGGTCVVTIGGDAEIGPASMPANFLTGYTKVSATKGVVEDFKDERFVGHVFGGSKGNNNIAEDANVLYKSWADKTYVTIGNKAFVKGSVYGGAENGHILHDTNVNIKGGQIGCGAGKTAPYAEADFIATPATVTAETALAECPHWEYGRIDTGTTKEYKPHDLLANSYDSKGGATIASDGHTYYGNVFGGGSGAFPYAAGKWLDSAGQVYGNTKVTITGGHILTSIYGGNEMTNVLGDSCVVIMRGGTLGVPRTLSQIAAHPVTCYLFGAGKGDTRTLFNTWTNVKNTRVHVGGTAKIYGSVFGGGEDGHVLENVKLGIYGGSIGTTGTSYVDGNVFGGGRGYTGNALTAGSVHGNVNIAIAGGTMLGSVYGGGRLASVGINMVDATLPNGSPNPEYGLLNDDTAGNEYGHVTINISGGTIGNSGATGDGAKYSGNVFGGSMGRLTLLDGETLNPLWPKLAAVKLTDVTISGTANIVRNVYGGGEYGVVRNGSTVTIDGNSIVGGNVFGGGYGSNRTEKQTIAVAGYDNTYYTFTPMAWAGCVSGNTKVNIRGGWVKTNVYGGGEYASVGLIDFVSNASGDFTNMTKHDNPENGFALSWPYEFHYHAAAPNDLPAVGGGSIGGKATVEVTGGRIGITGKDYRGSGYKEDGVTPLTEAEKKAARTDNGDIYGGSKGLAGDRYEMALCANVKETEVIINYTSPTATPENYKTGTDVSTKGSNDCIAGSVYGGGENGHVIGNTSVTLTDGLIGHAIYGGGKGKDKYHPADLKKFDGTDNTEGKAYSITAGKVYGNTSVSMTNGYVVRNIYGGGNMASVGKGNYAGGADDYTTGYGEKITTALWSNTDFTGSGKTTVSVTGGQVGYIDSTTPQNTLKDDLPYGNIYGGCRGQGTAEVDGINTNPDFYVGYVNETEVTIGTTGALSSNPLIYGSVYGGGQDGHVRRDTKVTINNGEIGASYNEATGAIKALSVTDKQWLHRGNVYGGGSGIGKYEYDYDGDGTTFTDANSNGEYDEDETIDTHTYTYNGQNVTVKDINYSSSAGSVTRNTTVDIKGGTIHRNVYGGGSLASVLPPGWTMSAGPYTDAANGKVSVNTLNISGGVIGNTSDYGFDYGGNVYGASRGMYDTDINSNYFAFTTGTQVNILPHPSDREQDVTIAGNVYGGGEMGQVKQNTNVQLTGGAIAHDVYGGGKGTANVAADVGGNVTVELNKAVAENAKGCIVDKIFGCNDYNGTPKGHALVHIYATQNKNTANIKAKVTPPDYSSKRNTSTTPEEGYVTYLRRILDVTYKKDGEGNIITPHEYISDRIVSDTITAVETFYSAMQTKEASTGLTDDDKKAINNRTNNVIKQIDKMFDYDVTAVYGGGDLAIYKPYGPNANNTDADYKATTQTTDVIIEGCDVTSIKQVYGGGNAASVPATNVTVSSVFVIDELFGGGNGLDSYQLRDGKWYENPGANVGYYATEEHVTDGTKGDGESEGTKYQTVAKPNSSEKSDREANYSYGTGYATTTVTGGRIHTIYGGSNEKGNIRTVALSQYQKSGTCPLITNETYGGSKTAEMDGEIQVVLDCVEDGGTYYGGSQNADVNNNVTINITNGTYDKVYGGNNKAGTINGAITINIEEKGCTPIFIGELYGGGYYAPYSVYGYQRDGSGKLVTVDDPVLKDDQGNAIKNRIPLKANDTGALATPHRNPQINIISATRIGTIYGGGDQALVIGSPHINVNMTQGKITANYANNEGVTPTIKEAFTEGVHGTGDSQYEVESIVAGGDATLAIGKIGTIYGGGNLANIIGNTYIDIGTGEWLNDNGKIETSDADGKIYVYNETTLKWDWTQVISGETTTGTTDTKPIPARNAAFITGSVYGGGKMGHVGDFTLTDGKPSSCAAGTGECHVTISNGEIGPNDMTMYHLDNDGNFKENDAPDNFGHVFGGGLGTNLPADANKAFVDSTEVIINGTAWVKGSVFGGGENGHVLHDTGVKIGGNCQIGNGHILLTKVSDGADNGTILVNQGINRRYTDAEWAAGHLILGTGDLTGVSNDNKALVEAQYAKSLPECDSWLYGKTISANKVISSSGVYAPHDMFANQTGELEQYPTIPTGESTKTTKGGRYIASDGRSFNGSVYGGGSGYFPYEAGKWLATAGNVGGDTWVEVTGGHILTSLYGGCEMTTVKGDTHVKMTGGTLGVPRTLDEIAAHPVTCYVFGGGKGEERAFLDGITNVEKDAYVTIGGDAWVYGSVFGGAEDGWINGNTHLNILNGTKKTVDDKDIQFPLIGTWGTSYVDGNIFGGGRGFGGTNALAGRVGGNVNVNISGGTMLGSVFGGGRLGSVGINDSDGEMQTGDAHGVVTVNISGGTIGNDYEYIYNPSEELRNTILKQTEFENLTFKEKMADGESETTVKESDETVTIKKIYHSKGGNIFGGGMGRLTLINGNINPIWNKLGHTKKSIINVSGGTVKNSVYGGGEFGQVKGTTSITFTGGSVGSEIKKDNVPQYTFGSIFGGGYGSDRALTDDEKTAGIAVPQDSAGFVTGNATINMSAGKVKASVYGGGKLAQVGGNTNITISGGEVGLNKVRKGDGYVMYGGSTMGNVYGGGRGVASYPLSGTVKGNTTINVTGGNIYHNVYGGGAIASIGTFIHSDGKTNTGEFYYMETVPEGIPLKWTESTGVATINITGGTIGINGRDNGMVFGSSRGDIAKPEPTTLWAIPVTHTALKDPYDKMAWVESSIVNIGETGEAGPHIKGSVYGGGENGHVFTHATVNVKSGTIGIADADDPWYEFDDASINEKAWTTRGNVYGAGCGTDMYDSDDNGIDDTHNAWAGCVIGNTEINISGGHITQNVYGGGAMGSVGRINEGLTKEHKNPANGFTLSWPIEYVYQNLSEERSTGKATINITGGRIGTTGSDNGDVFGGTRGEAGDRYELAGFANVRETEVSINYAAPATAEDLTVVENIEDGKRKFSVRIKDTANAIAGSVYGGGENGHVYENTKVEVKNGLIGHAIYGGGKGKGTYMIAEKVYPDLTAGKVYGNTNVIMSGGHVVRNIYGGGNLGSVGKGNYASGADDYYPNGYGEKITDDLWSDTCTVKSNGYHFQHSGKDVINITAGTVGFIPTSGTTVKLLNADNTTYTESTFGAVLASADANQKKALVKVMSKDDLPTGNIFGGCRGQAAAEVTELDKMNFEDSPYLFLGYVNETDITIGDNSTGPTIYGSVYGGGQDGHVRRGTKVTVNKGTIGVPYTDDYRTLFGTIGKTLNEELDNLQWLHRGNVFGGGSGIGKYDTGVKDEHGDAIEANSPSAGSVTHTTSVYINGGTIHRNVYGGGSVASVCPPFAAMSPIKPNSDATEGLGKMSANLVQIAGTIGTPDDFIPGFKYNKFYGGEVYGASRGEKELNPEWFSLSAWTKVVIKNGAHIWGNVFGGGDAGKVLKDSEVIVGE